MSRFEAANLIRVFDFYLASMFLLSFARRYLVYWDALRLLVSLRGRWPKLLDRLRQHHGVLVTREVIRPLLLALSLTVIQMICSRVIWPQAELTVREVGQGGWRLIAVLAAAVPMFVVDVYFLIRVGRFDRTETEKYLDLAEYWLASWKTPLIRLGTLGYVNPDRMVEDELKKGLREIGATVSWVSRWVAIQVACRVACGLVIWLTWGINTPSPCLPWLPRRSWRCRRRSGRASLRTPASRAGPPGCTRTWRTTASPAGRCRRSPSRA